jgi:hypothetical protein
MRAGQAGLTGSEGQTAVEQQFVHLNWGVARNPTEHDLGTDLWLMARDVRRFDLGALIGAQVKTGSSSFDRPERDQSGVITGWWFYDSDGDHFKYWVEHNVPHILVLHDLPSHASYWVHVTLDQIISTGKGSKILVPESNLIDIDHLDALLQVALGEREPSQWEGSAWQGGQRVLAPNRLRYALMAPRLIAPHQNLAVDSLEPEEAVAVLMKMRLRELQRSKSPYFENNAPSLATAAESPDWRWRFYAALYECVVNGNDSDALLKLAVDRKANPAQRACAAAIGAAFLIEAHRPMDAIAVIDDVLRADNCAPIDHAWLIMQRGRCLAEVGQIADAIEQAIRVQGLRRSNPGDPTAMAVVGAAADLVFTLSDWGATPIADAVAGRDTLAAWWRTQEVAWGLEYKASEDFKDWAQDRSITWGKSDQAWLHLRAASLIAGATGDHRGWRTAISQLGQRTLTTADGDIDATRSGLSMMRIAGDTESVGLAVPHLLRTGPIPAIKLSCSTIDLQQATRTTLRSDIEFVQCAADVLPLDEADRHAQWALDVLSDPSKLRQRLKPSFAITDAVLDMLASLIPALSAQQLRVVLDHVTRMPLQEDQAVAHGYAKVVYAVPQESWTEHDIDMIRRRTGDNFELTDEFEVVVAAAVESHRSSLQQRVAEGDWSALDAFGDVRDLDPETVPLLVDRLSTAVESEIARVKGGQSGRGSRSAAATLIIVNAWHPDHANWRPVVELLKTTNGFTYHLQRPLRILYRLGHKVPPVVTDELESVLRVLMTTLARTPALTGDPDIRGDAASALESMRSDTISENELWQLIAGSTSQRVAAAQIIACRHRTDHLDTLAALARDSDSLVSGAVANVLVGWLNDRPTDDMVSALLQRLVKDNGMAVARAVASRLNGTERTSHLDDIATMLQDHASAFVRSCVTAYFNSDAPANAEPS